MKLYLMGAGALQVKFASWLLDHGSATNAQLRRESILEALTVAALEEYLTIATDIRDRAAIRQEKERLSQMEYAANTKRHKRYPVLTTMRRLRLIDQTSEDDDAVTIRPDATGRLKALSTTIPNIETLERLIRANRLQQSLDLEMREYSRTDLPIAERPLAILTRAYEFAIRKGLQACPLNFLDDVLAAIIPASSERPSPTAEDLLQAGHKALPRDIRYHVGRTGKRAFVLLSAKALDHLSGLSR